MNHVIRGVFANQNNKSYDHLAVALGDCLRQNDGLVKFLKSLLIMFGRYQIQTIESDLLSVVLLTILQNEI